MDKTILKKRVKLSTWGIILTIVTIALLIGICIWQYNRSDNEVMCWLLLGIIVVWGSFTLYYCPIYVKLTDDSIDVETPIRVRSFSLSEIENVKICEPTMSEMRICGSGGFLGYWGWFREPSIGKYFAYYGKASQTFLIRLKSGRQYMLGCLDSREMAEELIKVLQKTER